MSAEPNDDELRSFTDARREVREAGIASAISGPSRFSRYDARALLDVLRQTATSPAR